MASELKKRGSRVLWYINKDFENLYPFGHEYEFTTSIKALVDFESDAIFVPGNIVPHFIRGVKVQVFHGLAGEKKGHFKIRSYFDLYLTQGPYFTERFIKLSAKYKNFDVIETGWPKMDSLFTPNNDLHHKRLQYLSEYNVKKIILYAPTFSPGLTSVEKLYEPICKLAENPDYLILVKFHDKMNHQWVEKYKQTANAYQRLLVVTHSDINGYMRIADLMISDTSSVVYEFLFLNKPVITLNSKSENIRWNNISTPHSLHTAVIEAFGVDKYEAERKWIIENYHPYTDGNSASRMVDAVEKWISSNGVPQKRKISYLRKRKVFKTFGYRP